MNVTLAQTWAEYSDAGEFRYEYQGRGSGRSTAAVTFNDLSDAIESLASVIQDDPDLAYEVRNIRHDQMGNGIILY